MVDLKALRALSPEEYKALRKYAKKKGIIGPWPLYEPHQLAIPPRCDGTFYLHLADLDRRMDISSLLVAPATAKPKTPPASKRPAPNGPEINTDPPKRQQGLPPSSNVECAATPPRPQVASNSVASPKPANSTHSSKETPKRGGQKRALSGAAPPWAVRERDNPGVPALPPKPAQGVKRKLNENPPIIGQWTQAQLPPPPQQQQQQEQQPRPPPPLPRDDCGFTDYYRRPISNDHYVYDEITNKVCEFIWKNTVANEKVMSVVQQCPGVQIEIEGRFGQIVDMRNDRLEGLNLTECLLRRSISELGRRFESTMSEKQHKKMNIFLNRQVIPSMQDPYRSTIRYKHTKERDTLYQLGLDSPEFDTLPEPVKNFLTRATPKGGYAEKLRVRATRTMDGQVVRKIIKHRIQNLDISSPQTEWDFRIAINLEIEYNGPIETLKMPKTESAHRVKDRMSYEWADGAYQLDLTQVTVDTGPECRTRVHELEIELNSDILLEASKKTGERPPTTYERLIIGLMSNLRTLSREMTAT